MILALHVKICTAFLGDILEQLQKGGKKTVFRSVNMGGGPGAAFQSMSFKFGGNGGAQSINFGGSNAEQEEGGDMFSDLFGMNQNQQK